MIGFPYHRLVSRHAIPGKNDDRFWVDGQIRI